MIARHLPRVPATSLRLETRNSPASDFALWKRCLLTLASQRSFSILKLGEVGNDSLLLLTPTVLNASPNLLVAAGFHGDELAGCWGILHFLKTASADLLRQVNLSFLPMINPTGFRRNTRLNEWGEDPNRGFCHTASGWPETSREGQVLIAQLPLLQALARDGFLSLHEDVDLDQFLLYSFEADSQPGPFSETLSTSGAKFFELYPDGALYGDPIRRGVVFRVCDGSFEDFLFHAGLTRTACTETPGQQDLRQRVEANASLIASLAAFTLGQPITDSP